MITWNRQRKRTRDRLLQYDFTRIPALPHSAGLPFIYPWENYAVSALSSQLFQLAQLHGYTGSEEGFWQRFITGSVIMGTLSTFPEIGDEGCLYLDTETDILYYFKETTAPINQQLLAVVGGAIIDTSIIEGEIPQIIRMYIPIKALPIENLILDCGTAAEFID